MKKDYDYPSMSGFALGMLAAMGLYAIVIFGLVLAKHMGWIA